MAGLQAFEAVFFHYAQARYRGLEKAQGYLAHYTHVDTAVKILSGRSLWLSSADRMNDLSEIDYGVAQVFALLESPLGARYFKALDNISIGLAAELKVRLDAYRSEPRSNTHIACLAEHLPADKRGLLSMWRGYVPKDGVALLFDRKFGALELPHYLNARVLPVIYNVAGELERAFDDMLANLEIEAETLRRMCEEDAGKRAIILNYAASALELTMLSVKHPGFAEEREWRIIYRPFNPAEIDARMFREDKMRGISDLDCYALPFHDPSYSELYDLPDLALSDFLRLAIIGPCDDLPLAEAKLAIGMLNAGILQPSQRIVHSDIPLRLQNDPVCPNCQ